jgi:2',3'-cyclic-nucleotide 2'-phosphodiesterase (5'-nucleotidase family)
MRKIIGILTASLLAAAAHATAWAEPVTITFVLANDTYKIDGDMERGGFARLNAVVKAERAKGKHVVYAHAGDLISPSLLSGFDKGAHTIALLNMEPPTIFVPGNHEFDFGPDVFAERMKEANFMTVAANLKKPDGKMFPGMGDKMTAALDGVNIAMIGLAADDTPVKSSPGDVKFEPTVATGVAMAQQIRKAGADFVVGVVHANRAQDRELFDSRAFDLILSGDDHDLMVFYDGKTAMAESREEAEYVVAIDATIDVTEKDGKRSMTWHPNFRIIDTATVTPDPETQKKIDEYNAELSKELDVEIGSSSEPLDSRKATVRTSEAAMGNLIADAIREAVGADIGITNGGGIRGNKEYPAGAKISRRDVLNELPFGNRTVKVEVTGDTVLQALENGFGDVENSAGRFPQISGMTVEVDLKKPKGERVVSVMIGDKPLDKAATYTLATNDFMYAGGDGYGMLKGAKPLFGVRDAKLMANDVMAYISAKKDIAPKVEGRIKAKM